MTARFEVFTAVNIQVDVFRVVTPCSVVFLLAFLYTLQIKVVDRKDV